MTQATKIPPQRLADLLAKGQAVLIDVREPDEFARAHIKGARSQPLSTLIGTTLNPEAGKTVVFTCRSGMRTGANGDQLQQCAPGAAHILEGGLDAWAAAGLPVETNHKAPLEMMRQVMIAAGLLVLTGVVLGVWLSPLFFGLAGFVGAGLIFAGVTGFCGMSRVLALAPWNRAAA